MAPDAVLIQAVRTNRGRLSGGAFLVAAHQAGEALVPVLIGVIIDEAVRDSDPAALLLWIGLLGALFAAFSLSFRYGARLIESATELAAHTLRVRLAARVVAPEGGAERGRLAGDLVNVATEDADRTGDVNRALAYGLAAVAGLAVGAVALLRVSVVLGLLVLLAAPPLLGLAYLLSRPLERRSDAEQERAAHASGIAADLVTGLRVLKGLRAETAAVDRYRRISRDSLRATVRTADAQAGQDAAMVALTMLLLAAVALTGGHLALRGDITVGQFVTAVGLAQYVLGPLKTFSWVTAELAQARASAARIATVLDAAPAVSGTGLPPAEVRGALIVRDLAAGPLRQVSLTVAAGELVAIVTADPAAATALLSCLARDRDPDRGGITLDGVALTGVGPLAAREAVLIAGHDAALFEESVLDNVRAAGAGPAMVRRALRAAGADLVCDDLPQGADTLLAERGRSLSGGQRQRVALARALAADAPVLVLHDPTTAVDTVTESRIAAGLRDLRQGRTTLVVATSPALLAAADRVVFLADGAVVAEGTHTDLVRDLPAYRELVLA